MQGSSPWIASPSALEIYGPYQFIAEVPHGPFGNLAIEDEFESDAEYDEEEQDDFESDSEDEWALV